MAILHTTSDGQVLFWCPGCKCGHAVPVDGSRGWQWNGSVDKPTITPSILVNVGGGNPTTPICHLHVTNGQLVFLNDCTHSFAGKIIDMEEP
jgi:hypothetical protein